MKETLLRYRDVVESRESMKGEEKMAVVTVDTSLCTGCGLCASTCPDIFEMGEDNMAHVIGSSSPSCDLNEVAADCPVEAIKIAE